MTGASIVIPSRGGAKRLPNLLSALAAQDDQDWEAIVVLDGDVDASERVVSCYRHLPVRTIVFPENRGRVAALNAGFADARGDVLIRCDDDLVPAVDWVRNHKAAHASAPGGAIGLCVNVLPDNRYAHVYGKPTDANFRVQAYQTPMEWQWRLWGGNVSTTRELWNRVGPYSPDYRAYGWEDVDWGYRLHMSGVPVRLHEKLEVLHHGAATDVWSRTRRAFHSGAARRTFESKHGADVLPSPIPQGGAWNQAVRAAANALTLPRLEFASTLAQVALNLLPSPLGTKAVALLVESAGVAGYQRPHETRGDF